MPRSPFSLKSAHLLMWSSPLLLLILVFTLTSASAPRAPEVSSHPPSSTSPVTTLIANTTTTSYQTTTPSTKVIETAKSAKTRATTATTPWVDKNFSNVTTTSVKPAAATSNANALSGGLSGTLGPGFESVDIPLQGPGNWTLSVSAPTNQSLNCGGDTISVESQVVVGSNQGCQLEIASTSAETSLTWQLTPNT